MDPNDSLNLTDAAQQTAESTALPADESVESLFRNHNQQLVRFLQSKLSSRSEAREVAQEAYVRLLQLDKPGAVGYLRAFLYKTAGNIAKDHLRRRQVAKAALHVDLFDVGNESISPEQNVSDDQEIEIVSQCLRDLKPRHRQAVLLCRVEGLGTQQVAEELGISTRMVRKYVSEALILIRERLETAQMTRGARRPLTDCTHE